MAGIFKAYDIRGTYPDQLDETTAFGVGYFFRDLLDDDDLELGPKVVVSRDMRSHSVPLAEKLKRGLRARGVAVIDIGVADTPQNYFAIAHLHASGGIQVTASHNPSEYNGFKMSRRDAIPVSYETGIDRLEELIESSEIATDLEPKAGEEVRDVFADYTEKVLGRVAATEPRLTLAADAANGMGTLYEPILNRLNIDVMPLYFELDGTFPNHEANPLKSENL
ncbi:MAG: phosphomannomutase/phosphoglucomutase, partial [Holophagae bacterium]